MPEYTSEQLDHISAAILYHGAYVRELNNRTTPAHDQPWRWYESRRDTHLRLAGLPPWDELSQFDPTPRQEA